MFATDFEMLFFLQSSLITGKISRMLSYSLIKLRRFYGAALGDRVQRICIFIGCIFMNTFSVWLYGSYCLLVFLCHPMRHSCVTIRSMWWLRWSIFICNLYWKLFSNSSLFLLVINYEFSNFYAVLGAANAPVTLLCCSNANLAEKFWP